MCNSDRYEEKKDVMQGDRQVHKHTQLPLPVMLKSDVDIAWPPPEPAVTSHTPHSASERESKK